MNKIINPTSFRGEVVAPPSKSYAHRLIICAALAKGTSTITNVSMSQDILATIDCVKALGADVAVEGSTVTVTGCGMQPYRHAESPVSFPCRESGSTLRFMIPIALSAYDNVSFSGSERLLERGIVAYESMFEYSGISTVSDATTLSFKGTVKSGTYRIKGNISSQYISGLLFALPLLPEDSKLIVLPPVESSDYIYITLDCLRRFGIEVREFKPYCFYIKGNQHYKAKNLTVEGDWSNAAFFHAMNYINPENHVKVSGLSKTSYQGDKVAPEYMFALSKGFATMDLNNCPDLAPVLFAVAAAYHGGEFMGTKRLAIKECNRAEAMKAELKKMGIRVDIKVNSVTVHPGKLHAPKEIIDCHNDHRIVMAMTLLLSLFGGEITDSEAVRKSFPDFFEVLEKITVSE